MDLNIAPNGEGPVEGKVPLLLSKKAETSSAASPSIVALRAESRTVKCIFLLRDLPRRGGMEAHFSPTGGGMVPYKEDDCVCVGQEGRA